jgi:phosphoenolpyruvate synthase/pyruvate phosphate dikinase
MKPIYLENKYSWKYVVERAYTILSYSIVIYCNDVKTINEFVKVESKSGHLYFPNEIYWEGNITQDVADEQIKLHKEIGNKYLWDMANVCETEGEKLLKLVQESLEKEDSIKAFSEIVERIKRFSVFIVIPFSLGDYLHNNLLELLRRNNLSEDLLGDLSQPTKFNEGQKESIAFYKLAIAIQENKEDPEKLIQDFINKYGWLQIRWLIGKLPTQEGVLARVNHALKEDVKNKLKELKGKPTEIEKELEALKLSDEDIDTIRLVKEYVYLRTFRTDMLNQAYGMMIPLLKKIAKKKGLSYGDLLLMTVEEIVENKKVDFASRKDWAMIKIDQKAYLITGEDNIEDLRKAQGIMKEEPVSDYVKGNVAYMGKVTGKIKVVNDPTEINKVKNGDILVAVMTFPSYIVAMEKASAFITDDGGVLCHAAIVARELKKPCIIGTKIATHVFKNGDMVEVDADNGVVRKVN